MTCLFETLYRENHNGVMGKVGGMDVRRGWLHAAKKSGYLA